MQDSSIKYQLQAEGADSVVRELGRVTVAGRTSAAVFNKLGSTAMKSASDFEAVAKATEKATSGTKNLSGATDGAAQATDRASKAQRNYFAHIAATTIQSAIINKLFLEFVDVAGQAIQSVDLMNNFPATMASMGQSTEDATESMKALNTYVGQIGGNIGQATSMVTRFTGVTKDVKAATAVFTGLNNALIAGDSSAEEQKQSLLQFAQAFERGKPDMREWNSLTQNMSFQLQQVAKEMGYLNANELGTALRDGEESMAAFATTLTEMSTGTGAIAQQAMTRMQGMQFAFNVLKNTMVQGLATIIQTLGRNNIVSFFTFGTQVVIAFTQAIVGAINIIISLASAISQLLGGPSLGQMKGDADGMAEGLSAGANAAGDLGDGLKDAKDDAKELNKSLAGFDKMNVLADKTGKKKDDDVNPGTQFDAAQLAKLGDLFGDMSGKIKEAGLAAKILAGVIGAIIAGLAVGKILDFFNAWDERIKKTKKNLGDLNKANKEAFDSGKEKGQNHKAKGKEVGSKLGTGLASGIGAALGPSLKKSLSRVGLVIMPVLAKVLLPVAGAITGVLATATVATVAIFAAAVVAIIAAIWLIYKNWDTIWSFIKDVSDSAWQGIQKGWDGVVNFFVGLWHDIQGVWDNVTEFFVGVWHGVYDVFTVVKEWFKEWGLTVLAVLLFPITAMLAKAINIGILLVGAFVVIWQGITRVFDKAVEFFDNIFQSAVDVIIIAWEVVVGVFQLVWDGIVAVFNAAADWFGEKFTEAWENIKSVWISASGWFGDTVIEPIKVAFAPVSQFLKDLFSSAWKYIQSVWLSASSYFSGIWTKIKTAFGDVAGWFAEKFQGAYNRVTGIFSGLWNWFRVNVWDRITSLFSGIGTTLADKISGAFRGVMNWVLRGLGNIINGFTGSINKSIDSINRLPGVSIKHVPRWEPPQLARGGVVNQATLAMIGESGEEAVVPLENNTEWIDKLAAKINTSGGNNGQPLELTVQIGEEKIVTKVIDLINEKTQMSGRNAIIV